MKLRSRTIKLTAGGKYISIIHEDDAKELGVHPLDRIAISKGKKKITTIINITTKTVRHGEIAVYDEARKFLNLKSGEYIHAEPRKELLSKNYIRKRIDGCELNYKECREIVDDVIGRNLNDLELAAFVTSMHIHGLTLNESIAMSRAMIETSKKIKFSGTIVDKHSIGGVPGDKTTMLLVPIIAACGLTIPKTSSRSITSPAGTADRMEVLAPVDLDVKKLKRVVKRCRGCLAWGGAVDLAPADDLLIQIEHPLHMDPLLLPSVMSKKKVVGSKYVVIDIPTGQGAKIKTKENAKKLAKNFITLGRKLGIDVDCGITRGDQPLGYAMGPALEAREVLEVITNKKEIPDVIDKVVFLSGMLLKMVGKGNKETALKVLKNGKAEKKLRQIIAAQGGNPKIKPGHIKYAKNKFVVKSKRSGIVSAIKNRSLVDICWTAGAPRDKKAGILLNKKIDNHVKKGEPLFTLFAENKHKMKKAKKLITDDIFSITKNKKKQMLIGKV